MALELTDTEISVIELKAQGYSAKQIADKIYRTVHAVKQSTKRAMKRNCVSNGFELVAKYAANHPDLFRNLVVAICLTIQGISMLSDYREDYRRGQKYQTKKIRRVRKSSRSKAFKLVG